MATTADQFVHLHVHSQYSLLDGACRTSDLPKRAKELGMSAVAVTDHGCLFGLVDFYQQCLKHEVKPIVGIEAYMAPGDRRDRTYSGTKDGGYHLLLLAQNRQGYQNLLKLASVAYVEGYYYKPRIDKETLRAHSEGLIATSACLGGEIPTALTASDRKKAKQIAEVYLEIFGPDRFFIELQSHIEEQAKVNPELVDLADKLGVGVVATNDVHFLLADDHAPHDALCCISTGKLLSDESRLKYPTQLYLKSPGEMRQAAPDLRRWQEACDNTLRIAQMCDLRLDFKANHAPVVKIAERGVESEIGDGGRTPKPRGKPGPEVPVGSTPWYKRQCSRFELSPFDSQHDGASPEDLKKQCDAALRQLAEAGAVWRYGEHGITPEIRARLDRELKVLADKSISAYFLIVWDFVNYARDSGIPANARGSGVGTMVGYCLGLSNACPVKYGLLFERFTDPDRSEYPDIDIDICQDGRDAVIQYVRRKYGHVAQIITFGTLKAKAAIRDVCRVMDIPIPEADKIAKLVPEELKITLEEAISKEPELRKLYDDNPQARRMLDIGKRLEGLARHASVHAAGVVIATQPLENIVPLYRDPKAKEKADGTVDLITQWDGPTCEKVGLLKMDFLGLRTLSTIERAKKLIRESFDTNTQIKAIVGGFGRGTNPDSPREFGQKPGDPLAPGLDPLDLDRLTFVDQNVLDLFRRGDTAGVFQFESGGMRSTLMGMRPDRLEDLIAANALFRPGPMALISDYNDRKLGRKPVPAAHPLVQQYTAETYGIMVYQEQVMQILHALGSIALREAYSIIKAISKKQADKIDKARGQFVEGSGKQGLEAEKAEALFELILKFAGYGFNKSHSTGYAIVAYQTAYLKTYFPLQYMAAVLTFESVNTEKVTEYIEECRKVRFPDGRVGVNVRPPDINLSVADFAVVYEKNEPHDPNHGHIRFGLSAVKGVGEKAIGAVIAARQKDGPFTSLFNFCERVPSQFVNKAVVEALVRCGAFDSLHGVGKRAAMIEAVEKAMNRGSVEASLRSSDDFLFGAVASADKKAGKAIATEEPRLPETPPWDNAETLKQEKAVLGFYASSHPLDRWKKAMQKFGNVSLAEARRLRAETEVVVGAMVTRVRPTFVKNGRSAGQKMAMFTVEDLSGTMDGVVFSDSFARYGHLLVPEKIVFLRGKVDRRREEPNLIIESILPAEEAVEQLTQQVRIVLRETRPDGVVQKFNGELKHLYNVLRQSPGPAKVIVELHAEGHVILLQPERLNVKPQPMLQQQVADLLADPQACEFLGPPRLVQQQPSTLLPEGEETVFDRLEKPSEVDAEFCESIDRY